MNKRYCHNCGKEIPIGSRFCRFCGNQQYELKEESKSEKKNGYFISHWKFLFAILGPAFIHSLLYGLFIAVVFFVIEFVAAMFGYCITARGQECSGTGGEIIYIPLVLGGFYFAYGAFSVMKRALIVIAQSPELKMIFGLLESPKTFYEYFTSKGIHTMFIPKYLLLIMAFLLALILGADLVSALIAMGIVLLFADLRFLRWLFIKSLKLNKYQLEATTNE